MKKLFLLISVVALVVIFAAAILALLSVFNLMPFFTQFNIMPDQWQEKDQVIILVATVDTLDNQKITVEKVWLIYYVLSRHDTMMVDQLNEPEIAVLGLDQPVRQRRLVRAIEKEQRIRVDYYMLLDEQSTQFIGNLYYSQQNSVNSGSDFQVCEILTQIDGNSLIKAIDMSSNHIKTNLSNGLLREIIENKHSVLCNYMD